MKSSVKVKLSGKWDEALNELHNLSVEVKKKSGIVSLIAAIQEIKGDVQGAVNTLDTARKGSLIHSYSSSSFSVL